MIGSGGEITSQSFLVVFKPPILKSLNKNWLPSTK